MEHTIILTLYFTLLVILSIYGFHRYQLLYLFYKNKKNIHTQATKRFEQLPRVTIQLPVFNELYVVERLIDAVMKVHYPKDHLQVQVLDDSTDETTEISQKKVREYQAQGFDIEFRHRLNRKGFKAGALEEALQTATGEFICVFDADFLPEADFLEKVIHFFTDPKVAVVQARWDHVNRNFSLLTQVQAIFLDGHFVMEQTSRNISGRFFNFNGTAGIWRRAAIKDAGGWEHDTLTEDLDLSYRAQLKGWKFIFLPYVTAPAELPIEVNAFKSQQHRWAKGSIQTALKVLGKVWKSEVPLKVKIEATLHLTSNVAYVLMFFFCILLLPAMVYRTEAGWLTLLLVDFPLFFLATISVASFYIASEKEALPQSWVSKIKYVPFVTSLGIGLCLNNAKAVVEAVFGYKTGFVRTPKYNNIGTVKQKSKNRYRVRGNILPILELSFGLYFTYTVYVAATMQAYFALPFFVLFQFGFLYMGVMSILPRLHSLKAAEIIHVEDGREHFSYEQKPKLA